MAKAINRLSARSVTTIQKPGRHAHGAGLYLAVDRSGARRWVFLSRRKGRLREMGLGSIVVVSLSKARELAAAARADLHAGIDPIDARARPPSTTPTFGERIKRETIKQRRLLYRKTAA